MWGRERPSIPQVASLWRQVLGPWPWALVDGQPPARSGIRAALQALSRREPRTGPASHSNQSDGGDGPHRGSRRGAEARDRPHRGSLPENELLKRAAPARREEASGPFSASHLPHV